MSHIVFSVESGDRLVLMKPVSSPYEKAKLTPIVLSFIQAPRIARRAAGGEFSEEDPCAYEAAELIRSRFIGKPVRFIEDYYNENLQRSGGRISLQSGEDASQLLLQEGLALIPPKIPQGMDKPLFDTYTNCMNQARKAKKGLFAADAAGKVRSLKNLAPDEQEAVLTPFVGKELLCRVEKVLSTTGLVLSSSELGDVQVPVRFTGILDKDLDGVELLELGKVYVERFILNRNVQVRVDGFDKFNNTMISVVSKKGTFQEELLSKGFVKLHNATLALSDRVEQLQKAELQAKENHVGTWKNFVAKDDAPQKVVSGDAAPQDGLPTTLPDGTAGPRFTGPLLFEGKLVQVVQGDILVVQESNTNTLYRLSLAGVRCSRNISRSPEGSAPETRVTYDDYAWESKEFVRSHYIGKKVTVQVEYARCIPKTMEVRPAAVITDVDSGDNINAALIESGFAHFFLAKSDVCSCVTELKTAEENAKEAQKGIYGEKHNIPVKVVELNRLGESKAKYYLNFLQKGMQGGRPPVLSGVVDVVLGPSSLRVFIPKERFQISVKLAGITTPQSPFGAAPHEVSPLAEEAKLFTINLLQQRDVNVQVFFSDRGGNFICGVSLPDGTNASVALAEAGYASVSNADKLPFCHELCDAEEKAREAKLNIFDETRGEVPVSAAKAAASADPFGLSKVTDDSSKLLPYVITEVGEDGISVYLQDCTPEAEEASGKMQALVNKASTVGPLCANPKKGELVVALYAADNLWCRGKVLKVNKASETVDVKFIDFGNADSVSLSNVHSIPSDADFNIVRDAAPYARLAHLAFLKQYKENESATQSCIEAIYDFSTDVLAKAVYKDASGSTYFTVTTNENVASLNETLLQRGLAMLDQRAQTVDPKEYKRHEAAKDIARKGHKGIWQFGDIEEDDDL
ncbi:4SNc-Tudor domain protein [Angomonas deanei]|nr:4SNc-Tudor domain protein [Angomonas deanei]|eukprot:EPY43860.1 4SNc-Tudor domain protein [Angomonas deanei]